MTFTILITTGIVLSFPFLIGKVSAVMDLACKYRQDFTEFPFLIGKVSAATGELVRVTSCLDTVFPFLIGKVSAVLV